MKIGKCEFGLIKETDNTLSKLAWKSGKLKKYEQYVWKPRTLKWFLKEFFTFDKLHYNLYRGPCKCLMLDFGPFYFTILSKECNCKGAKQAKKQLKKRPKFDINDCIKISSKKCEYCGMTDGIHKSDCIFMRKL